jgi:hypothetical protein
LLLAAQPGGTVTFDAMSAAVGRDILRRRHVIDAARRVALREAGAAFVSERSVGYKRLAAVDVAETIGAESRQHIRRTARHARRVIVEGTSRANDLPPDTQRRIAAEVSVLGLMEHLARDATAKPAADAPVKPTPVAITAQRLLAAIGG